MTYHGGEVRAQELAGVRDRAAKIGRSIRRQIPPVAAKFLTTQPWIVAAAPDRQGRMWATPLCGKPGFVRALDEVTVRLDAVPPPGDPLHDTLVEGSEVGLVAIDLGARQRMRVNGRVLQADRHGLVVTTDQVYANCPKYIQARELVSRPPRPVRSVASTTLTPPQRAMVAEADTFFVASRAPGRGADASHRGGAPGFVRVCSATALEWPDYPGNTMFNTIGNMLMDARTGLLFIAPDSGSTVQLTGRALLEWEPGAVDGAAGVHRSLRFLLDGVVEMRERLPFTFRFLEASPFNPT